jgi:hypothetical protein
MVGRKVFRSILAVVAIVAARPAALAGPITFTGNVTSDFSISTPGTSTNTGVTVIANSSTLDPTSSTGANGTALLNDVAPGDAYKQVAVDYNAANDTLYVGIQTWGVTGSVSAATIANGNGMVVGFSPLVNGTFNPANISAPTFVAGTANVSTGESNAAAGRGAGLDGFNVAAYAGGTVPGTMNLLTGFGTTISSGMGNLAFNPSTSTPDYEFSIPNFSKLLGANPVNGFVVMTQDGEINVDTSKDNLVGYVPLQQAQSLPEPTTWMVWAGLAGGMAWGYRRRSRRSPA